MERSIKKYGKENFKREILEFCNSYDELLEKEKIYVDENWVKDKNNYNLKTGGQSSGTLSDESKLKISETLKRKHKNGEIKITPKKNYNAWNRGKKIGPRSQDSLKKQSESLKEFYKNNEHHSKGKTPWNKGLKTGNMSEEQKEKISKTLKENYKKIEHHRKGVTSWNAGRHDLGPSWNKGIKMEQIRCPYCDKMVDKGNAKRWHFDNCKLRSDKCVIRS